MGSSTSAIADTSWLRSISARPASNPSTMSPNRCPPCPRSEPPRGRACRASCPTDEGAPPPPNRLTLWGLERPAPSSAPQDAGHLLPREGTVAKFAGRDSLLVGDLTERRDGGAAELGGGPLPGRAEGVEPAGSAERSGALVSVREASGAASRGGAGAAGLSAAGDVQGAVAAVALRPLGSGVGGGSGRPAVVPAVRRPGSGGRGPRPHHDLPLPQPADRGGAAREAVRRTGQAAGSGRRDPETRDHAGCDPDRDGCGQAARAWRGGPRPGSRLRQALGQAGLDLWLKGPRGGGG